jgi:hypothetical protein
MYTELSIFLRLVYYLFGSGLTIYTNMCQVTFLSSLLSNHMQDIQIYEPIGQHWLFSFLISKDLAGRSVGLLCEPFRDHKRNVVR